MLTQLKFNSQLLKFFLKMYPNKMYSSSHTIINNSSTLCNNILSAIHPSIHLSESSFYWITWDRHQVNRNAIRISLTSGSSASIWFRWMLSVVSHWNTTSCTVRKCTWNTYLQNQETHNKLYSWLKLTIILLFSSLSRYWSLNMWQEPSTASLPAFFFYTNTQIQRLCMNQLHE